MCEYVYVGMDEARGAGDHFFLNCGTFYNYVLIALQPFFFFFLGGGGVVGGRLVPV